MSAATPAVVLGGTGYVAGELLRLIAGHPQLEVAAILSDSQPGAAVAGAFAHLRSAYPTMKFSDVDQIEALLRSAPRSAL
jgi:N-acetyl-gamma-glutamyl-phosphate reductase